jgi:S1-C subfamily serine protease
VQYQKFPVLLSLILLFCGCAKTHSETTLSRRRPVGFWKNKEAIVQVLHFYSRVNTDKTDKPVLDDKGRFTTSVGISLGTGFVLDTNGLVGTNNHIVNEKCPIVVAPAKITTPIPDDCPLKVVITPDQLAHALPTEIYRVCLVSAGGRDCRPAEVFVADLDNDLALVQTNQRFPHAVEFVDDIELIPGDKVYFWGNVGVFLPPSPFFGHYAGRVGPTYFMGDAAGKYNGDLLPLLFMDIYLAPGNSGSPIFNTSGKAICVNNSVLPSSTMGILGGRALGVCIPSSKLIQLRKKNPWPRPKKK